MKNLKRVLSMALATVMVMGMMVVGSGAANTANEYGKAIATVKVLGVMEGDENGNFNADKVVTRNEMAVVMANLADLKLNGAHPFSDVPNWAEKYVGALYTNGLTSGTSATTYGGSANITTTTAALMIMKTMGYFEYQGEFGDDWALSTVKRATKLELFDDIDAGINEGLTRGELAQMIVNALDCKTVDVTETSGMKVEGNGLTVTQNATYDYDEGKTLLEKLYDKAPKKDNKVVVANLWTDSKDGDVFGRPSTIVKYDGEEIEVAETADIVLVSDDSQTLAKLLKDEEIEYETYFKGYNGDLALKPGYVVELFVNEDDDDVLDAAVVYYYEALEITEVEECDEDKDEDAIADGAELKFEIGNADYYDFQLPGVDASELEKDTYIAAAVLVDGSYATEKKEIGDNKYDVYYGWANAEVVTDVIDIVKNNTDDNDVTTTEYVKIGSTKYVLAVADKLTKSEEYDLYLDPNGFVIKGAPVEGDTSIEDVYVVDAVYTETDKWENESYFVQLVDLNGEIVEVELEENQSIARGTLVTIADEKVKNSDGTTKFKANNDKYVMAVWSDADYMTSTIAAKTEIAKNDKRVETSNGTKRLNSATNYVMISDTKGDLEVVVKEGGVALTVTTDMVATVITEKDEAEVLYVVVTSLKDIDENTEFSDDLIFIKSASSEEGEDYINQTVYFADGSKKTLKIADDQSIYRGFFEYTVNSDGLYEIEEADSLKIANYVWDEEEGTIVNAYVDNADFLYDGLLTVKYDVTTGEGEKKTTTTYMIEDINVSDAEFVDAHSKTSNGQYDKAISSLEAAIKLIDKKTVDSFKISMNVSEDGAVVIVLTDAYLK